MGGCSVKGCKNRFSRGKLHFYRFPKDEKRRNIWIQFTNLGKDFVPKPSSTICQVHFENCFVEKKNRVHLSTTAVPTIYYKPVNNSTGFKKYQLLFDAVNFNYYGQETIEIFNEMCDEKNEEMDLRNKKQKRCEELLNLCRYCFSTELSGNQCIDSSKLRAYNISEDEIFDFIGIQSLEVDSNLICESCFLSIVEFDSFRKKCRDAQNDILNELNSFDSKIEEIVMKKPQTVDTQTQIYHSDNELESTNIEILEEHLDETQLVVNYKSDNEYDETDDVNPNDSIDKIHEGFQIVYQFPNCNENLVDVLGTDVSLDQCHAFNVEVIKNDHKADELGVDEYEKTQDIIKNPERNRFCFKIYECFFCKLKFAGRKTYVAHKCLVKEIKCNQCNKVFNRIQAYNSHQSHIHKSLPISKHFCPLCRTVIYSTMNQFKQHKRSCNKETKHKPEIECEVCSKICFGLKGYSIHKIFHETRNFTTSTGEKLASDGLNSSKRISICELCGKNFQSTVGYRMHKRNVHRVGQVEKNFLCNICSKTCPTKRSLFDHMRNTHRVQESPCVICGKVFRNKILLKKHMIYHDESKRVFKCKFCPDKPAYFTNVALKRHEKSHLGSRDFCCDLCDVAYSTNHQLKNHKTSRHGICFT